jgi:uncharacterized protein YjbK
MNAAVKAKYAGHNAPLVKFIAELDALITADKYRQAAEAFHKFEESNPGNDYFVEEALPFKLQNHIVHKLGKATAFVKLTLKKPTWAVEATRAFHDPAKFETFVENLEAEVKALA